MNWIQSLLYGFLAGATEFLPVSAEAHRDLLGLLFGVEVSPFVNLLIHLGVLAALIISCVPHLARLRRERALLAIPAKRRKRQPDPVALSNLRILRTALVPILLGFIAWPYTHSWTQSLWASALMLTINGIVLYIAPYVPQGNKDATTVSGLDGLLMGLGAALAMLPGISRIAGFTTSGILRGCQRRYVLDLILLLCIPALIALVLFDLYFLIAAGTALTGAWILSGVIAMLIAAPTAYLCIIFLRFLSVKVGFSGFAYYSWGAAMFTLILYLTI
ncbi:MAG: hypothetical protein J6A88_01030 [Oscillospiraceae bacterium]|nr:hypothetical protein [Oscillospiraceae bacterium]